MSNIKQVSNFEIRFGTTNIEFELEQAENELNNPATEYLTREEVIESIKKVLM